MKTKQNLNKLSLITMTVGMLLFIPITAINAQVAAQTPKIFKGIGTKKPLANKTARPAARELSKQDQAELDAFLKNLQSSFTKPFKKKVIVSKLQIKANPSVLLESELAYDPQNEKVPFAFSNQHIDVTPYGNLISLFKAFKVNSKAFGQFAKPVHLAFNAKIHQKEFPGASSLYMLTPIIKLAHAKRVFLYLDQQHQLKYLRIDDDRHVSLLCQFLEPNQKSLIQSDKKPKGQPVKKTGNANPSKSM